MATLKENFLSLIGKVGTVESNYEKALEKSILNWLKHNWKDKRKKSNIRN